MSEPRSDCLDCRLLKTEVALLKSQIASQDVVIAQLTERPSTARPELAIRGLNKPARLVLVRADAEGEAYRVSLEYWNLSVWSEVAGIGPAQFLTCFEELARQAAGWDGLKTMASRDGDFAVSWEYQGHNYQPEVWAHVRLANDWHAPQWTAELRLELRPDMLEELAERARLFFAKA
jgi:hypothetical protein